MFEEKEGRRREIEKMPKKNGRVIRYALSGYNNKEIAKTLGISINSVKSIKYAEIRKLRQLFAKKRG